ncbi:MAG: hypothetical protein F6J87_19930 [Spirulina sp. SIO3F2]|nr:hypothetical protein [Spirulina sp. SIO3F2]
MINPPSALRQLLPWHLAVTCGICGGALGGSFAPLGVSATPLGLPPLDPVLEEFEPENEGQPNDSSGAGGRCWEPPQRLSN